jgi:hypothetical protein
VIINAGAVTMRTTLIPIGTLCLLAAGLTAALAQPAARNQGACVQIRAACQTAGFAAGGARTGAGIEVDCIIPIMQGTSQRPRASKPLPSVDPQLVADCKAANPRFGQPLHIVFVLTDDLALNLVQYMPHVVQMQKDGVTFANYFVTDSLCCPSRTSIFTGRFPHDSGIYRNTGADGGFLAFHGRHHEQVTFATALQAVGYRTAMLGKYLNGYEPAKHPPQRQPAPAAPAAPAAPPAPASPSPTPPPAAANGEKSPNNPVGACGRSQEMPAIAASITTSMRTAGSSTTAISRPITRRTCCRALRCASSRNRRPLRRMRLMWRRRATPTPFLD